MTNESTEQAQDTMSVAELQGSLDRLTKALEASGEDDIAKSQITTGPGSSKGSMKTEKEDDTKENAPNGTDYKKGMKDKEDSEDFSKSSVCKGCGSAVSGEDTEKAVSAGKEDLVNKKTDYDPPGNSADPTNVAKSVDSGDINVQEWMLQFSHVMHKSFESMEQRLNNRISKSISSRANLTEAVSKNLGDLKKSVQTRLDAVEEIEKSAARPHKSVLAGEKPASTAGGGEIISKGVEAPTAFDTVKNRGAILERLVKGMEEGKVAPFDISRFESSGAISNETLNAIGFGQ